MSLASHFKPLNTQDILARAQDGQPLSGAEAVHLLLLTEKPDLSALKETAAGLSRQQAGERVLFFGGVSLFLTNLCEMRPSIYPYPRQPGDAGAFVMSIDDIDATLEMARLRGLSKLTLHGGFCSTLQIPGLEAMTLLKTHGKLLEYILDRFPEMRLGGFSPDEIEFLSIISDRSPRYLLEFLKDRGLETLNSHGVEVLVDSVRQRISPGKMTGNGWLKQMALAAELDLGITLGMDYGHLDTPEQRVEHLTRLQRFLQAHEKVCRAVERFIPQPLPAKMSSARSSAGPDEWGYHPVFGPEDRLKHLAVCRLMLGALVPSIQTQWLPDGEEEAQEGLLFGASHFGGTDATAYVSYLSGDRPAINLNPGDLDTLIRATGQTPKEILAR